LRGKLFWSDKPIDAFDWRNICSTSRRLAMNPAKITVTESLTLGAPWKHIMTRSIDSIRRLVGYSFVAAAAAVGGILLWEGGSVATPSQAYAQQTLNADTARGNLQSDAAIAGADQLSAAFRNVARSLKPSVVSIRSVVEAKPAVRGNRRGQQQIPGIPPEFRQFFGDSFPFEIPEEQQRGRQQQEGTGSGVIVSANGHILTNNHVVAGADKLEVQLSDKRTFEAKVVGTDPKSDLAVLKVEATGLVAAPIGDSSLMQVGDWVIAIGSPFGLTQTVTSGIVSATNRDEFRITDYDDFIQTDAAINPGNSGGPLLNLRGEVIGINTAIASRSGGFNGIGFSIPSNIADYVMKSILKNGKVTRGFVGTQIGDITPENASEIGVPAGTQGAVISTISKGGPADKGGLKPGDVVTAVNGAPIESSAQLRRVVAFFQPGTSVKFDVLRNGKSVSLNVVIEEQTDQKLAALAGGATLSALGIAVEPLTREMSREFGLSNGEGGVLVSKVDRDGPMAELVAPGEVIMSVNNEVVSTPDELASAIGKARLPIRMVVRNATTERMIFLR
jgi:serine protease Do